MDNDKSSYDFLSCEWCGKDTLYDCCEKRKKKQAKYEKSMRKRLTSLKKEGLTSIKFASELDVTWSPKIIKVTIELDELEKLVRILYKNIALANKNIK